VADQKVARLTWKLAGLAAAIPAGILARKVLDATWKKTVNDNPPANPAAPGTTWPEALAWSAASGIAVGVFRMIAQRGAVATWRTFTGSTPPGMEDSTA